MGLSGIHSLSTLYPSRGNYVVYSVRFTFRDVWNHLTYTFQCCIPPVLSLLGAYTYA